MEKLFLEIGVIKRVLMVIGILALVAGAGRLCYALPFNDTEDFFGTGTDDGRTYLELSGANSYFEYSYSHVISFIPEAESITSAILTLSHKGNSANSGEAWFITGTSSILLGTLINSTVDDDWVDQPFDLSTLLSGVSGSTWTIGLKLYENTTGSDKLWLDKSVVAGDYSAVTSDSTPVTSDSSPVPEPSTMLLLGSGFVGLVGFGRKIIRAQPNINQT